MGDENKDGQTPQETPTSQPATPQDGDKDEKIPRSRLNEVLAEKQKLADELAARKAKDEETAANLLKEQGKFKELAEAETGKRTAAETALSAANERLSRLVKAQVDELKERIKALPEELRELVDEPTEDTVEKCLEQMKKVEKLAKKAGGATPGSGALPFIADKSGRGVQIEEAKKAQRGHMRRVF